MLSSSPEFRKQVLTSLFKLIEASQPVYLPSKFWQVYSKKNNKQFIENGYQRFKVQQGLDYFQFLIFEWSNWQFQYVWDHSPWFSRCKAIIPALTTKKFAGFKMAHRHRWLFAYFHYLLWDFVKKIDTRQLLQLSEPLFGSPLLFKKSGRYFTQDLLNSIIEAYSIIDALLIARKQPKTILEVGGGYGRVCFVLKKLFPKAKIIMVDIPPAILLAQWYMSHVFPKSKFMFISGFSDFEKVRNEYEAADFVFLLPHQIELLPAKTVDLFLNINSFQEMTLKQIDRYFNQINRLTQGIFYTKQWKHQHNRHDEIYITEFDYPTKRSWLQLFHRDAQIQKLFFEAAYKIK